jgi:hypothetical protein
MTRFASLAILLSFCALLCVSACAAPPAAATGPLDWTALLDLDVIEIITTDEDGDVRATKVWFVLVGDVSYLRTSSSRWLENIRRNPQVTIRIDRVDYPQVATDVTSADLIEQVDAASRAKYGWQDSFIHTFRSAEPQILKLSPPTP